MWPTGCLEPPWSLQDNFPCSLFTIKYWVDEETAECVQRLVPDCTGYEAIQGFDSVEHCEISCFER